ncbi:MAG: alginate lyase family protein [Ilumatobacteraceae bacterium]
MSAGSADRTALWYWRRLRRFQRGELVWRISSAVRQRWWLRMWLVSKGRPVPVGTLATTCVQIDDSVRDSIDPDVATRLVEAAQNLMSGQWTVLGIERHDLTAPDWTSDGTSDINRSPDLDGTVSTQPSLKHTWELSRHHILTVLATASWMTGDPVYSDRAAELLAAWVASNDEPSTTVHWSSVEIAERLISWVWLRRLATSSSVHELFETQAVRRVLYLHLDWLRRFPSRFSSANNHRIAELAGLLTGACGFADLIPVGYLRAPALESLQQELALQVGASGLQREPALDYHCFVFDLAVISLAEAARAGLPVSEDSKLLLTRMADALALCADDDLRTPRFGDSDESEVAQMDAPGATPAHRSLSLAAACFGPASSGWPTVPPTVRAAVVSGFAGKLEVSGPQPRSLFTTPQLLATTGYIAMLRSRQSVSPEVWAAMRVGEFSYLPIGSHSHADLLSLELRVDGEDLIVDPGTYCYQELPQWRRHFRSTSSHSTLAINGEDQVEYWGAFLWGGDAKARVVEELHDPSGDVYEWVAEHDAYRRFDDARRVRRTVRLDTDRVSVFDRIVGGPIEDVVLTWSLGERWRMRSPKAGESTHVRIVEIGPLTVTIELPHQLKWGCVDADAHVLAPSFGRRSPTIVLDGRGTIRPGDDLLTVFSWNSLSNESESQT